LARRWERLFVGLLAIRDGEEGHVALGDGGEDLVGGGAAAVAGVLDAGVEAVGEHDDGAALVSGALGEALHDRVVELGGAVGLDAADGVEQRGAIAGRQLADLRVEVEELDRGGGRQRLDEMQRGGLRLREDLLHRERGIEEHDHVQLRRHRLDGEDFAQLPALDDAHGFARRSAREHRRGDEHAAGAAICGGFAQAKLVEAAQLLAFERAHLRPVDDGLGATGDGDERGAQLAHAFGAGGDELPETGGQAEDGVAVRGEVGAGLGTVEQRVPCVDRWLRARLEVGLAGVAYDEGAERLGPVDRRSRPLVLDLHGDGARVVAGEFEDELPSGWELRRLSQSCESARAPRNAW
jgi:hypothetical protein